MSNIQHGTLKVQGGAETGGGCFLAPAALKAPSREGVKFLWVRGCYVGLTGRCGTGRSVRGRLDYRKRVEMIRIDAGSGPRTTEWAWGLCCVGRSALGTVVYFVDETALISS